MIRTDRDLLPGRAAAHLDRATDRRVGAIANLAARVLAPAIDGVMLVDGAGVIGAGGELDPALRARLTVGAWHRIGDRASAVHAEHQVASAAEQRP